MTASVLYQASEGVATLTLNRPDVLNAMNGDLMRELREGVERAAGDAGVRAVLITGAGRGFCAGADLAARGKDGISDSGTLLRERYHPIIMALRQMPKPVVTAVNGVAAGAGMSLALAGDVVLAARSASFLQAFSKIGLVPDAGSTYFVPRYAGEMRARALAILAEKIDAEEAQRIGLVWKVHADDALQDEAGKLARHLATMPTMAYGMIKEALNQSFDNDLAAQLEVEATLQSRASRSDDCKEGVAAFMEKRKPQFKGR
ncbi:Enoyl-CoA hydratase/carnithine racemase [Cupriavidus necator]|uniref:2-(1,2-epoxy-1,2-dihydrophenyl)acetyl-CoA isomerase n=1 Tax=Cupriavidus necator (strain ATCC 17699 / DSM 428 / KCTC 22496 / NCIMB 10442 / H16 / Stanier 337) TaxID=381666 RepID=Q0K5S0_CUPNH|nr:MULTISPECIES: enoyl-CoA hydratase-related protein [Cupriavidus]EON21898.1 enoyl-CoA hydratase [Cupriavidus sp. GA3-3]KUE86551.1 enoyl-CoA hydratase [Cupriavidus necator]QCC02393.1 2-(1,2-epoxy-1,2-dihydrophenyl)acetyl-CoA isomerase [Cupriavidus necator H16]QQB78200.1 enoyl-CoA hydratase/isomerase family protein [Cupriavidus necator]WKA40800.1 enoyl-CoA hydratase-related protein [Cupriavidus necator]